MRDAAYTRVVDDVLHDSTEVSVALRVVEGPESDFTNTVGGSALEDSSCTFTLLQVSNLRMKRNSHEASLMTKERGVLHE